MRLFIAANFSASDRQRIYDRAQPLRDLELPVRWLPASSYHLTLRFLGEQPDAKLSDIRGALEAAASGEPPFRVSSTGVGATPSLAHPRVLWLELAHEPSLTRIHGRLSEALAEYGFRPEERAFRPHLTLGRTRRGRHPGAFAELPNVVSRLELVDAPIPIGSIDLMQSELLPTGARYRVLARALLVQDETAGTNQREGES